jgi:hypothetical protein
MKSVFGGWRILSQLPIHNMSSKALIKPAGSMNREAIIAHMRMVHISGLRIVPVFPSDTDCCIFIELFATVNRRYQVAINQSHCNNKPLNFDWCRANIRSVISPTWHEFRTRHSHLDLTPRWDIVREIEFGAFGIQTRNLRMFPSTSHEESSPIIGRQNCHQASLSPPALPRFFSGISAHLQQSLACRPYSRFTWTVWTPGSLEIRITQ